MHQQDLVVPLVVDDRAAMTPRERAELVLSFARVFLASPIRIPHEYRARGESAAVDP